MEDLFTNIGFESAEQGVAVLFILVVILFAICIALIIGIITLLLRKKDFSKQYVMPKGEVYTKNVQTTSRSSTSRGNGGRSRINPLVTERLSGLEDEQRKLTANIDDLYRKAARAYQKVGLVKYNAYTGLSGNTSFVIAMLDATESGFIINVINSREGSNVYMKDINNGRSNERLGAEEAEAFKIALSQ